MNLLIKNPLGLGLAAAILLAACSSDEPVHSVDELMRNEVLLEATLVRCTQNRSEMRYEPQCVNVREAVKLIEVREEKARREQLEAQSQRKRDALRRTQAAVAEARRRAAEQQSIIESGGVVVEFEETPPAEPGVGMVGSVSAGEPADVLQPVQASSVGPSMVDAAAAEEQPAVQVEDTDVETVSDLETVRQELERRAEDGNNP